MNEEQTVPMTDEELILQQEQEKQKVRIQTLIKSLRDVADFYEQNPNLPIPYSTIALSIFSCTKEDILKFLKGYKGIAKKEYYGSSFYVTLPFESASIQLIGNREQVCTKIETKKMVEKEVPIQTEKRMVEETVVEWVCSDSIFEESKH